MENTRGVIVGSDERLEWLLPWWWRSYSYFSTLPVAFFDFGMSEKAKNFCKQKGELIAIEEVDPSLFVSSRPSWADSYGPTYEVVRQGWFKKPLALAATPFEETLWLDLDCEVLSDVSCIFSYAKPSEFIAAVEEITPCHEPYTVYNGGVILYRKNTQLIDKLKQMSFTRAKEFWGDDRMLSYLIHQEKYPVIEMHPVCNWRYSQGIPVSAIILHWSGDWGKRYIKSFGGAFSFVSSLKKQ